MTRTNFSLGGLLHEIERLMKKRFDRFAEDTGMSRAQWHVLAHVGKTEGLNQASLADHLGVEPITICRMVDRLEGLGLVERRSNPTDRRARQLYLTDAARPGIDRMRAVARDIFAEALVGFSPEEAAMLTGLLGRVYDNLLARTGEEAPDTADKPTRPDRVLED